MSDESARRERLQKLVADLAEDRLETALKAVEHVVAGGRLQLEPLTPAKPDVRTLVTRTVAALKGARWSEALELSEQALSLDPELRETLTPFRATAYLKTGFPDLAARTVARCRPEKLGTRDAIVLARVMREARIYHSAESLLQSVLQKEAANREAYDLLRKVRDELKVDADPVVALVQKKMAAMVSNVELLARGGMAIVCRGYHHRLKRNVAIKVLHPDYLEVPGAQDRFLLEAVNLINIAHKNLIEAFTISRSEGFVAYVMELLEGAVSTEQSVKGKGPFAWTEALKFLVSVSDALAVCHKKKIVHRDVKPDNILLLPDGRIKLIDLGAADFGQQSGASDLFTGTLRYSAPEALMRKPLGPPADVYSLAVTFHDLVMGMNHDVSVPPDPTTFPDEARDNLRTKGVGKMLREQLHTALDPDPKKRFEDAAAWRQELSKLPVGVAALPAPKAEPETKTRVDDQSVERLAEPQS
jgi:hypothetical protein